MQCIHYHITETEKEKQVAHWGKCQRKGCRNKMKQVPYHLAEALENICKKKSLESITVSEIAAEAGVTRQVFYHHFADKFELASWIHYVHLYQSVKKALEETPEQIWRGTTLYWLKRLEKNKAFYVNAFQSVSQKEFQRILRDFFLASYRWQLERHLERTLKEEEMFALRSYCIGGMEMVYEWMGKGALMSPEQMLELLELAMPEILREKVTKLKAVPYAEAIKTMEEYLSKEGLLQAIS